MGLGRVHTNARFFCQSLRQDGDHRAQYQRIKAGCRVQRGNVSMTNLQLLNALLYGAELQMARFAEAFWQLAYHLHADESLEQGWRLGSGLCPAAGGTNPGHSHRTRVLGQHDHQSASRRHRGAKKNGPQAIGVPGAAAPPRFIWLPRMLGAP